MNKFRSWINRFGLHSLLFVGLCILFVDFILERKYVEGIGVLLCISVYLFSIELSRLSEKMRTMARKMDWLLQRADASWKDFAASEIRDHLQNGRRLDAIMAYRAWHGTTLMEAKREIETIERDLP